MGIANDVMESVKSAQKINESEDYLVTFGKDGKDETKIFDSSSAADKLVMKLMKDKDQYDIILSYLDDSGEIDGKIHHATKAEVDRRMKKNPKSDVTKAITKTVETGKPQTYWLA